MTVARLGGAVALFARAQLLADEQRRTWFVLRTADGPFATADDRDVPAGAVVAKLIPGAPSPVLVRV